MGDIVALFGLEVDVAEMCIYDWAFVGGDSINVGGCQVGWSQCEWALMWQHLAMSIVGSTHISR